MSNHQLSIDADDHVVISLASRESSRKFRHQAREADGSFKPDCGIDIETPVLVPATDIPIQSGDLVDLTTSYARCSRCSWDS